MRLWKILAVALGVCAIVLMLSALVEAPAALPDAAGPVHAPAAVAMIPAAVPPAADAAEALKAEEAPARFPAVFALSAAATVVLVAGSDANGRVLRKKRYAASFYPLFRLELACG